MSRPNNKPLDIDWVRKFLEDYDHLGSDGWVCEFLDGNINAEIMKKAVIAHANENLDECQQLVDQMFTGERS